MSVLARNRTPRASARGISSKNFAYSPTECDVLRSSILRQQAILRFPPFQLFRGDIRHLWIRRPVQIIDECQRVFRHHRGGQECFTFDQQTTAMLRAGKL
jgi:hypothetical protein